MPAGPQASSPWRWPAAAAALVITASHVPVTAEHLSEAPYIGWSFVALEITGVVLAAALVLRDTRWVWWAAAVVPALAIVAYGVTRSVALPQIADDVGNWAEPFGIVALTAEAVLLAIALAHCFRGRVPRRASGPEGGGGPSGGSPVEHRCAGEDRRGPEAPQGQEHAERELPEDLQDRQR